LNKTTYHFKPIIAEEDNFRELQLYPTEELGKVELLTGKWGYIRNNTEIFNYDKPIEEFVGIEMCLIDYNETTQEPPPPYEDVEFSKKQNTIIKTNNREPFSKTIRAEVRDHMLNIDQQYIDNYHTHIKIVIAILRTGHEDIAYECMLRSSNTKNKNLDDEYEKFKNSKLYNITPATLYYYSKLSNIDNFFKISQKYEYHQLKQEHRRFFTQVHGITEEINERYLPKNMFDKFFINNTTPQTFHLQSPMGTGKTTVMKHLFSKNDESVLYLSPRRTFSNDIHADLKFSGFQHYRDIVTYKSNNNKTSPTRIICQIESLHKIADQTYDIVVIDEIESCLTQLVSPTNIKSNTNHQLFQRFIHDAKKVFCMDAFLSAHSQETIDTIKPNTQTITIVNSYKTKQNWTATEIDKYKNLTEHAITALKNGKKIVFVCGIKKVAMDFTSKIPANIKYKLYTGDSSDAEKKFLNIDNEWCNYDCLVYTGVITCGVSFDPIKPHYDSIYCYISPQGSSARDIHQSLQRVRNFKETNLYFCVNKDNAFKNECILSTDYDEISQEIDAVMTMNQHLHKLPIWAMNNYKYSILIKNINYISQLAIFCEYLRFQGYRIVYCDYSDMFNLPWDGTKYLNSVDNYTPSNMNADEYEELQKRCYDLTETDKHRIRCFMFEMVFDWLPCELNDVVYKHFHTNPKSEYFHIMFNKEKFYERKDIETERELSNMEVNCCITSTTEDKYKHLNKLCELLDCDKIYRLEYDTLKLMDKKNELLEWVDDVAKYYTFRKCRGNGYIKYINSIIKHVSTDFCGLEMKSQSTSKKENGEKNSYYKYTNYNYRDKQGNLPPLYELFNGLEDDSVAQQTNQ
jgi:hypothetical protein